ncbi:MAG: UDP-glucose/GDP-mannose dehydrogenase family protein [Actinobacteria bacterium]|nr:UDP-glucose/GDP-mannose dehydrogenase family protein [Actinomycetota bacterium]
MTNRNLPQKICIIGPGVVGLATGRSFLEKGIDTTFIGRNIEKNNQLKADGYNIYTWEEMLNGHFDFDISMLTVPTPTTDGKIDLSPMKAASIELGKRLCNIKKYHVVVVKSTVLPGTTRNFVGKIIEEYSGKKFGEDLGLCMNPEYLREKTAFEDTINPWIITIGEYDKRSGDTLSDIYRDFDSPIYRLTLEEAEIQKYVHNLFNACKISFFNEMREIGEELELNMDKVFKLATQSTEGLWNPKYGTKKQGPFSGSCLPKDTQAFLNWSENNGFEVNLLRETIKVNERLRKKMGLQKFNYEPL